jgi:hypothetical protein
VPMRYFRMVVSGMIPVPNAMRLSGNDGCTAPPQNLDGCLVCADRWDSVQDACYL